MSHNSLIRTITSTSTIITCNKTGWKETSKLEVYAGWCIIKVIGWLVLLFLLIIVSIVSKGAFNLRPPMVRSAHLFASFMGKLDTT